MVTRQKHKEKKIFVRQADIRGCKISILGGTQLNSDWCYQQPDLAALSSGLEQVTSRSPLQPKLFYNNPKPQERLQLLKAIFTLE